MANLRDIKGHIGSVQSIAKVTRAMEMVSAAKSHRLQSRVESTRPFAEKSWDVLVHLTSAAGACVSENPMFCGYSDVNRTGLVLMTSNRGMVGRHNHDLISLAIRYLETHEREPEIITIGRTGREAMLRQGYHVHADFGHLSDSDDITALAPVTRVILDGFAERHFDEVVLVYTEFHSALHVVPRLRQLLPLCPDDDVSSQEYIYEPSPEELLLALTPRLIRFQVYQALLESLAAENAARRTAMHAASQNASELIEDLTVSYNKARQQSITTELIEVLGGSGALVD